MCRLCDATGPLCRYLTDQDWATTTTKPRSHNPLPPDDILVQLHQTSSSQAVGCPEPDRPRHGCPKAAVRGKPVQKTGTCPPKPAVRPNRLHWPALTSGTHCAVTLYVPGAQSARADSNSWFETSPGLANSAEVLCYAFLVANINWKDTDLAQWATKVLSEQGARCKAGQEWVVPDDPWWRPRGKQTASAYAPLRVAVRGTRWEVRACLTASAPRCRDGRA